MPRVRFNISVSLDGYVAGPDQTREEPLGRGGEALHEWVVKLQSWRASHGMDGGTVSPDDEIMLETLKNAGATIMGREMFGGGPGPWDTDQPWMGWWGKSPPFKHPVFIVTHYQREPVSLQNGTTFTFVTGGIREALEQAREAAGGKDVMIGGGADVADQFLAEGLVDEMELHVVPILLGGGSRLFEKAGTNLHGLELVRTVQGDGVVHLKFARETG